MRVCIFFYVSIFIPFSRFIEKTRIQTTENLEKDNSEIKQEIRKKTEVNKDKLKL